MMSPPGLSVLAGAVQPSTIFESEERAATFTGGLAYEGRLASAMAVVGVKSDAPTSLTARYLTLYTLPLSSVIGVAAAASSAWSMTKVSAAPLSGADW